MLTFSKAMKRIAKDKKGIFGMESATAFVIGILALVLIAVVILMVLGTINTSSVVTATNGSSTSIIKNVSSGIETLFANAGLWFTLLGVTILILIVVVVIVVLKRTQSNTTTL